MDHRLIGLLVCPLCKSPLKADRMAFPVRDGIAVMLESEARSLDAPSAPAPME